VAPADIRHAFAARSFAFAVRGPIIYDSCRVGSPGLALTVSRSSSEEECERFMVCLVF
jgi:hypothetical protein